MKITDISDKKFSFNDLLNMLNIFPGETVFLHTSFGRLNVFFHDPGSLIDALIERIGPFGTLAMPRYAWNIVKDERPWAGYKKFMGQRAALDLRNEPANIGIIPETFRKRPGVAVSTSYFWPVSAIGLHAETVTRGQENVGHPYSPDSTFGRLHALNAHILGMGVSLNTSSLAPVSDWALGAFHHKLVFTPAPVSYVVIDLEGARHEIVTHTLLPEAVCHMKPSAVIEKMEHKDMRIFENKGTLFFHYPFQLYHQAALLHGGNAIDRGLPPPWLCALPCAYDHYAGLAG